MAVPSLLTCVVVLDGANVMTSGEPTSTSSMMTVRPFLLSTSTKELVKLSVKPGVFKLATTSSTFIGSEGLTSNLVVIFDFDSCLGNSELRRRPSVCSNFVTSTCVLSTSSCSAMDSSILSTNDPFVAVTKFSKTQVSDALTTLAPDAVSSLLARIVAFHTAVVTAVFVVATSLRVVVVVAVVALPVVAAVVVLVVVVVVVLVIVVVVIVVPLVAAVGRWHETPSFMLTQVPALYMSKYFELQPHLV